MAKTVLNTSIFNADIDSHINTGTAAANEVLSYTGSDYDWVTQSGGVALTDFSVTTNSAGTAALSYSNSTGVFSYTPPDLSGYLTAETNDLTSAVTWANVPNANITESSVTQHEAALSITSTQVTDFGEAVDDQVNTLLQAGLGIDFTYDDANNELLIDSNHVEVKCTNNSGSSIPIGTPVYQTGVSGNNITIAPADADDSSKMPAIGMTTSTLADEAEGTIVVLGVLSGLDTSSFSAGDTVYVSTTAGGLTTTPPTGESGLIQNFGRVLKVNASNGSIAVMGAGRANAVANLNDGNIFIGNSSNQAEARALVEADISDFGTYLTGITSENIGSLSDVTITTVADNEVLAYDSTSSAWINQTAAEAGLATSSQGTLADSALQPADLSVTTNTAGTAALSYSNGVFTYTPPDLSSYLTAETNDLTSAVTWANVPNANITESSVTQHQSALSITESQISDFGTYLTGITGENIGSLSDVTITSASNGQVLKYNGTAWVNSADSGIALTDLSVTTASAGTAALSYNNSTGAFTFTPPDLSSYLTGITSQSIENLSDVSSMTPTDGQVLTWDNTNSYWYAASPSGGSYSDSSVDSHLNTSTASTNEVLSWNGSDYDWVSNGIGLTDLSVTTASAGTAALSYNNSTGAFTYTPPDLSSYLTAETNDLTSAVTWANVPNANITESSVTQHQSALSITESQISDFGTYLTGITSENIGSLSDVTISSVAAGEVLRYSGSAWVNSDPIAGRFSIVNSSSSAYVFTGSGTSSDSNPTLYLTRGQTYEFVVNASGHPFYIKTVSGTGTGNAYSDGVTNNGAETGTVTLDVQMDAPDTLYYNCSVHSAMAGTIYILDSTVDLSDFSVTTASAGTAALSYSNGVFTYTPPDLSSYLTGITAQSIENLSDVTTMTPTDGQVLTWDNTNSYWYAASPSGGSYGDSSVDTHLNTSTASTNEVLSWDGSDYSWVAQSGGGSYSDSSVDTHLNTSTASANQVLSWTGSDYDWVAQSGGGGGASVTASDTAPSSPSAGDLWFDSTELVLYVYYNDGDSSQWVQSNPTGGGSSSTGGVTTGKAIAMAMIFGG